MKRIAAGILAIVAGCGEPGKPAPPPGTSTGPVIADALPLDPSRTGPILRFPNLTAEFPDGGQWGRAFVAGERLFLYYGGPGSLLDAGPVLAQAVRDGSGWKLESQVLLVGSSGSRAADLWPGDPPTYVYSGFRDCHRPSDEARFVNLRDSRQGGQIVAASPPWLASLADGTLKVGFFDGRAILDPAEIFFSDVDELDMAADEGHAWILADAARNLQLVDLRRKEKYRRRSLGEFRGCSPRVVLRRGAPIVGAIFWRTNGRNVSYAWIADASVDPPRELLRLPGEPEALALAVFHDDIVAVVTGASCEMLRGSPEGGWKRCPLDLPGIRGRAVLFELDGRLCALWQRGAAEIVVTPIAE